MSSDAKKTAVKEKFKARPGIGRILPETGNELVPVRDATRTTIRELNEVTVTAKNTVAPAQPATPSSAPLDNTRLTQYGTFVDDRTRTETSYRPVPKRRSDRTPWLFLVPALALVAFVWFDDADRHPTTRSPFAQDTSRMSEDEYADRVEMHRKLTGRKMNRERVDVQIQNHFSAPALAPDVARQKAPDIMAGVPLAAEAHPRAVDASKPRMVDPDSPENRIMYGLREEQEAQWVDQQIEKQFVKEFVENARRGGYDLKVNSDGTVVIKRAPSQTGAPGYSN